MFCIVTERGSGKQKKKNKGQKSTKTPGNYLMILVSVHSIEHVLHSDGEMEWKTKKEKQWAKIN